MHKYNPDIHHRRSIRLRGYDYTQAGLYFITLCVQNRVCLFGHIENNEMIWNDAGKMAIKWYHELQNKFPDIQCHEMVVMPNHMHFIIEIAPPVGADLRVGPYPISNEISESNEKSESDEISDLNEKSESNEMDDLDDTDDTNEFSDMAELLELGDTGDSGVLGDTGDSGVLGDTGDSGVLGDTGDTGVLGDTGDSGVLGEHVGSPQRGGSSVSQVVQWIKTMTTNEYIRGVKNLGWVPFDGKLCQRNYYEHIIRNEKSYWNISLYIQRNPEKWFMDKLNQKKQ